MERICIELDYCQDYQESKNIRPICSCSLRGRIQSSGGGELSYTRLA